MYLEEVRDVYLTVRPSVGRVRVSSVSVLDGVGQAQPALWLLVPANFPCGVGSLGFLVSHPACCYWCFWCTRAVICLRRIRLEDVS